MVFDLLLIFGLIILNGFFALSEIAIVTAKKGRLQEWADEGRKGAETAIRLADNPNQFLSSIQVGITLIGIIAGAYAGANLTAPFAEWLQNAGIFGSYSFQAAYIIVVIVVTYFTLIIGELVPKRVAMHNPEKLAARVARPIQFMATAARPFVWLLSRSTKGVLFLIGSKKDADEPSVTTGEIRSMLAEGIEEGTVEEEEHEIVTRLFQFGDQDVAAVMTPRREIAGIDLEASKKEQKQTLIDLTHTRAVVYRNSIDEVAGIIHVRSVLDRMLQGEPFNLKQNIKNVQFVSENTSALQVLKYFRQTGEKIAIIIDEYGGVDGLVTLDDILEALVGDIPWVGDTLEHDIYQKDDNSWMIEGKVTIEQFKDSLSLPNHFGNEQDNFRTVGGWITNHFDQIPDEGDHFNWQNYSFKVLKMDSSRVEKIQAVPLEAEQADEEE